MTDPEAPDGRRADEDHPDELPVSQDRLHGSQEEIDEAGDETFPASDAPQWWAGTSQGDAERADG